MTMTGNDWNLSVDHQQRRMILSTLDIIASKSCIKFEELFEPFIDADYVYIMSGYGCSGCSINLVKSFWRYVNWKFFSSSAFQFQQMLASKRASRMSIWIWMYVIFNLICSTINATLIIFSGMSGRWTHIAWIPSC